MDFGHPGAGKSFLRTSSDKMKDNLIVFLTPHVVRNKTDLRALALDQRSATRTRWARARCMTCRPARSARLRSVLLGRGAACGRSEHPVQQWLRSPGARFGARRRSRHPVQHRRDSRTEFITRSSSHRSSSSRCSERTGSSCGTRSRLRSKWRGDFGRRQLRLIRPIGGFGRSDGAADNGGATIGPGSDDLGGTGRYLLMRLFRALRRQAWAAV